MITPRNLLLSAYTRTLAFGSSLYWRTPASLRPFLPYALGGLFWGAVLGVLALLSGCHTPAPARVALPSAAPVKVAVAAARQSNAKVVQLARQAETQGLAAGSDQAKALSLAATTTEAQLAAATTQVDLLTGGLLAAQKVADAQTRELADVQAKCEAQAETISWYRWRFWPLLGLDVLALLGVGALVAVWLLARFTAWGGRTFGPYVVGAGKVAAKVLV